MALGVSYNGEKIQETKIGFRDVENQLPPNADTIYGVGSITKIFTASAIGILVDEGLLDWSTPLREVLPEFHHRNECVEHGLTISDLLYLLIKAASPRPTTGGTARRVFCSSPRTRPYSPSAP